MALEDIKNKLVTSAKDASASMQQAMGKYSSPFGSSKTTFDTNSSTGKYDVANLTYPIDLFAQDNGFPRYGNNYAIFYINVAEDSKLLQDKNNETVNVAADERLRASINQIGLQTDNVIVGSTIAGAAAGTILGSLGGSGGAGGAAGAFIGGASAAVVSAATGGKLSRQQKRLKSAIALHVPNALSVRYSATWNEEETGAFQAAAMLSEGGMKSLSESVKDGSVNMQSLSGPAASVATALALNAPGGLGSGLSAASGLAPNPKKEQLFKGVDFRTFTFDYQFAPKSIEELEAVIKIIDTFKYHMHPEFKDSSSFVFIYPSEFDIHYYHGSSENQYLHRHTSCVLKDMNINYTPNGMFNTFGAMSGVGGGAPTQINVQLTFVELAILTKDQIKQGY